jgi:hypothetical protein
MIFKFVHTYAVIWSMGIASTWAAELESKGSRLSSAAQDATNSPAMSDIHDIKPAIAMGIDLQWLYWVLATTVFLVLGLLVFRILKKRKRRKTEFPQPPPLTPDAEAYQMLDDLAAQGDLSPKQFYFQLSAILRRFIERHFLIPAVEMTTEELLPKVDQLSLKTDQSRALKDFCRAVDPIKFASAAAEQSRMASDLAFARDFVHQSTIETTRENDSEAPCPTTMGSETPSALPPYSEKG